jgi:nuclear pore complex protein Nup54
MNVQPPQQQASQQLGGSVFSPPTVSVGAQGHLIPSASLQRLQMSGFSTVPNERKIADQIRTLTNKWNPQDSNTLLKAYLYNAVDKSYAPFFYPDAQSGEDEQGWEEALNQRPTMPKVEGAEATALAFVPVLCRGFKALGDRVETQAKSVLEMRNRLHEMNNSLSAVMDKHQQSITVRIENAKRQHQVLSQRCLHLAVKVQVLRNRGYALDAAEEGLRRTLIDLNQRVHDDGLSGREDEIWARMVALRERTRWLEEEGKRVAAQVDTQQQQSQNRAGSGGNNSDSIPQHVLLKTRKIMKDYDDQLTHLSKELEEVTQEYARYQSTQR